MPGTDVFDEAEKAQGDVFDQASPARPQPIKDTSTIGPSNPAPLVSFNAKDLVAPPGEGIGGSSIGNPIDVNTTGIENYTQQGRAEHPVLSRIGDVTRGAKELLFGGQEAGKPMGTSSGVANNPVTTAMSLAPAGADVGAAISEMRPVARAGNAVARTLRQPYTGTLKPGVPRLPWMKWADELVIPRGEVGSITNPGPFNEIPGKMPKPPVDAVTQAVKEGRAARIPTRMPMPKAAVAPIDELTQAVREGRAARLPTRIPRTAQESPNPFPNVFRPEPQAAIPQVGAPTPAQGLAARQAVAPPEAIAGIKGSVAKPSGRLVLSPQEAQATEQMQKIAKKRASEHGMQYAAGMRPSGGGRVPMTATGTETFEGVAPRARLVWNDTTGTWEPEQ